MALNRSNSTTHLFSTTEETSSEGLSDLTLIALVVALSLLVIVLITVILIVCCKRKMRRRQGAHKAKDIVVRVLSLGGSDMYPSHQADKECTNITSPDYIDPLPTNQTATNQVNREKTKKIRPLSSHPDYMSLDTSTLQKSAQLGGDKSNDMHVSDQSTYTKLDVTAAQEHSPYTKTTGSGFEQPDYLELVDSPSTEPQVASNLNKQPTVDISTPVVHIEKETYTAIGDVTKPILTQASKLLSGESEVASPELPRLKGRRSRDIHQPTPPDKESTLKRATNLFRSDTKAFEFYKNTLRDYEIDRSSVKFNARIGKGHFGQVYSGTAKKIPISGDKNKNVAIKTMKSSAPDSEKQEFLYEVEIMKLVNSMRHPNIIKLLGCVTKSQPCLIVLELMTNGNLQKFLRDTKCNEEYYNLHGNSDSLTERNLLQFALDIAKGMEAIADLQLLHRDLATRNILVDENLTCKVADFGFAKDVLNKPEYSSKSVFQRPRPTRWLPPESLFKFKHSIQSDVWSYGIVLWEIVTLGNLPYPGKSTREVMTAIARGYRMTCPYHCTPDIYRVMAECWEETPAKRPTFHNLVEKMQQLFDQSASQQYIDIDNAHEDDYIDTLPTHEQELFLEYASSETLC